MDKSKVLSGFSAASTAEEVIQDIDLTGKIAFVTGERWSGYGQSKTANILFAVALDARGKQQNIRALALHPGTIVSTDLKRYISEEDLKKAGVLDIDGNPVLDPSRQLKTVEQGAATSVWCATSPKLEGAYSLSIMGAGAFLFIPAASQRSFPLFLTALFVQGSGLSLLQTASNPYISILGPIESAARRISIMGICNKMAGFLAPIILGFVLLKGSDGIRQKLETIHDPAARAQLLNELASRVAPPYIVMGIVLLIVAFFILRSGLPEIEMGSQGTSMTPEPARKNIFAYPHLLLGVLCIFLYVGVEVMAGDAIAVYGKSEGMSIATTKNFGSLTLLAMLIGYVVGIICIPRTFSQQMGLRVSAILGLVFSALAFLTTGFAAITFIALLGLANALMWPAIWPLAIDGLGKHIKTGSAMLVMGIAGGAVIPLIYASLKDNPAIGNKLAFSYCMAPCYVYILYYAIRGHKMGRVANEPAMLAPRPEL